MLISEALEGKAVSSSQGRGTIQYAEKRSDVYLPNEGVFAYAVKVRQQWNGTGRIPMDFWTTIYVGVDE